MLKKKSKTKNKLVIASLVPLLFFITCLVPAPQKVTIWMIGDSTMCEYKVTRYPLTGWGMPFVDYFDSSVVVNNRAKGGRSTRTFVEENRWQPIVDSLREGDYVFIQFGHNDEAEDYPDRYTPPQDYRLNLKKFVTETKDKGGRPVLITPVSRRYFDESGQIKRTHEPYSGIVRDLGRKHNVPVIDLDQMSRELFQRLGPDGSKFLFMQIEEGENPIYPDGIHDNTHFNAYGARHIAELVLQGIQDLNLELAGRIVSN